MLKKALLLGTLVSTAVLGVVAEANAATCRRYIGRVCKTEVYPCYQHANGKVDFCSQQVCADVYEEYYCVYA